MAWTTVPHSPMPISSMLTADGIGDDCDADVDGDGMSDAYEQTHALDPLGNDALADADGDGFSNLAEFYASSSASDSTSRPDATASPVLVAAVLPSSRSAQVGQDRQRVRHGDQHQLRARPELLACAA